MNWSRLHCLAACRKSSRRTRQYMVAYKAIADGASLGDIKDGTYIC